MVLALLVGALSMIALGMVAAVMNDLVSLARPDRRPVATISLDLADQVKNLQGERARLAAALGDSLRQTAELERRLAEAQRSTKPAASDPAPVEAIRRIEAELREAETRNADLTAQLAALRAAHGDAGSRAAADGQTIDALRRDLAAVVRERDALQSDLGAQNTRLREANDGKDREIAALQQRLAAAERRIAEPPLAVPSVPPPPPPPASDTPGGNADVVQGIAAYQAGNYADAYRIWRPLAERGVARAQFHLGALYYEGRGVARDLGLARRWLERALANGYAPAEVLLARVETDAGARGTPPAGDR